MTEPDRESEARLARRAAIALPIVTIAGATVMAFVAGAGPAILVLAAGTLLGVIALFWSSLRVLTGEAELPPELEALEASSQGSVDQLATRKKMLLRALKDLENERAIGKLEADDFEPIAATYRAELKTTMKRIDESIAPHRAKAEDLLREHLLAEGLLARDEVPASTPAPAEPSRLECAKCGISNEKDAKFCKGCGATLATATASEEPAEKVSEKVAND